MAVTDEIKILVNAEVNKAIKDFKKTQDSLKTTEKRGLSLGKVFTALGGAFVAKKIIDGLTNVTKRAIDAQETFSKFRTVFKAVEGEAENVAKSFQRNFGLSSQSAKQLLADTGDLLSGFGFTGKAALDLSKEVNELAVDLASFTNFSGGAEGASQALTKALLGERESVKSLGIAILETDVQAKVLQLRQQGLTFETERQAKAFATLRIAQEQSKNAIGDFARTSADTANVIRRLQAVGDDLAVTFGQKFLPILTPLLEKLIDFAQAEATLEGINKAGKGIITVFLVLKSIVTTVFNLIQISVNAVISEFNKFNNILKAVREDGIGGLARAFKIVTEEQKKFAGQVGRDATDIADSWKSTASDIAKVWKESQELVRAENNQTNQEQQEFENLAFEERAIKVQEELEFKQLVNQILRDEEEAFLLQQLTNIESRLRAEQLTAEQRIKLAKEAAEIIRKLDEGTIDKFLKENKKALQEVDKIRKNSLDFFITLQDIEINKVQDRINKGEISEKEGAREIAILRRKQAQFQKAQDITTTIVDTISSAQKAFKALAGIPIVGPALGAVAAGVALAAGFARVAQIRSTPLPEVPAFQEGGVFAQGGTALVGEAGPELVNLPAGTNIVNNTETNEILNQPSLVIENVNMEGVNDPEAFLEQLYDVGEDLGISLVRR